MFIVLDVSLNVELYTCIDHHGRQTQIKRRRKRQTSQTEKEAYYTKTVILRHTAAKWL